MTTYASIVAPDDAWLAKAEPEEAIESALPIVDAHLHLWDLGGYRYFVAEHARDIEACGHRVDASVYVECFMRYHASGPDHMKYVGETEHAVEQAVLAESGACTLSQVARAIVGYADLTEGERTRKVLEAHLAAGRGRFRGIRQRAKWDADPSVKGKYSADKPQLYLDPAFQRGMRQLASLGLSFDASVYHPQIGDVVHLSRANPDTTIVLNHCGSPVGHGPYAGQERHNHAVWLAGMKALAQCPNAHVKLGGVLMNLANFDFSHAPRPPTSRELADLWRPWIEPCLELFGVDRCMVSSNFPVDRVAFGYRTVWNMFKRIAAGCSADEKAELFAGTARRVYRID